MKALLAVVLIVVLAGGALKLAGMRLPVIDYPIGPLGTEDGRDPDMPGIEVEAPGFGDFPAP